MLLEEGIRGRRSVRQFDNTRPVSRQVLEEVVELARYAPSWKNSQVPRYHVVVNPQVKGSIARECVLGFDHNTQIIEHCPALVVLSVVTGICGYEKDGTFSTSQGDHWETFDAGIAAQTFSLAAHAKGLGSVILGIFDEKMVAEYIRLPEGERAVALIALGYPLSGQELKAPRRKDVGELLQIIE